MNYMNRFTLVFSLLSIFILPAFTQSDAPTIYLRVDYMKVAPGNIDEYVKVEQEVWKPIHAARVKAGIITGWYLISVMFPSGTAADYNYLTVNVYDDFSKTTGGYPDSVMQAAYPDADEAKLNELMTRTLASRDLVCSELWVLQEWVPTEKPARYQVVNFFHVAPGQEGEYLSVEREIWKPIHQTLKNEGYRAGWGAYSLMFPGGTQMPYNFGTVDFYNDYAGIVATVPDELFLKAHANATQDTLNAMMERTVNSRELVHQELRELVDFVNTSSIQKTE